jgi:bifunctional DNA-binding transcriptional regulator/antitoxin component of YhaV-PrlF toxin-antitoxin module
MIIEEKVKVGKKGEILPKKPLREISGIRPGDNVLIEAQPGRLIGTAESVEKDIEEEMKIQEKLTNEEH